jgi:hypothetical protein
LTEKQCKNFCTAFSCQLQAMSGLISAEMSLFGHAVRTFPFSKINISEKVEPRIIPLSSKGARANILSKFLKSLTPYSNISSP